VFLRQVLLARGIRQSEIAERAGLSAKHIKQIVNESIGITGDVAVLLECTLRVPELFWTRAEALGMQAATLIASVGAAAVADQTLVPD
jgi:plasmid maintenance system antidote protein VapI